MPLDKPVFPGEAEINLFAATLTSSGCTSPALAVDDDPATAAVFGAPAAVSGSVSLIPSLYNTGVSDDHAILADGSADPHWQVFYPAQDTTGQAFIAPWPMQPAVVETSANRPSPVGDARVISNITAFGPSNGGTWVYSTTFDAPLPLLGLVANFFEVDNNVTSIKVNGVENLAATLVGGSPLSVTLTQGFQSGLNTLVVTVYNITAPGPLVQDLGIEWTAILLPQTRFLRVDWGFDAFLSRVRLAYSGPGAASAGVDYESSLSADAGHSPPLDVAFSSIPGPADGNVHEVVFDPPVLARGAVFYPDALLGNPPFGVGPSSQAVALYEIEVYQDVTQGIPIMPNPTTNQARVGCSGAVITPRAYTSPTSYPFPQTAASVLRSIQSLSFSEAVKLARETGGETVHQINGYETDREVKCKISVERYDYLALQNFLAGTLIVNPANAGTGQPETQYHAPGYTDRAPYFSLVAQSTNGDPSALFVLPKCKIDGSLSADLERDKVTMLDVDFVCFWDYNYTRQDGTVGGIYEQIFNNGGTPALHS